MRRGVGAESRLVQGLAGVATLVLALALGGCANGVGSYDPVAWWHDLEGGRIAQERPPPPGINAPYPNLATIPAKPQPLSATARTEASDSLLADRANGDFTLAQPLAVAPATPTPPPAPSPDAMGARMPAAGSQPPAPAAPAAIAAAPAGSTDTASLLTVPAGPPAAADLPGVPWLIRPTPPPAAPPIPPAPPAAGTGKPVSVSFARGSAVLSADDSLALRLLAGARASSIIAVTGYGDAADPDPAVQGAALRLAWARAVAIAAALRLDGVPDNAMTVTAFAPGGGGAARLLGAG